MAIDLPLLPLGRGRDLSAERGVECPGDLPPASDPDLVERARAAKAALGERVFVLGHHYQRDEVIQFADVTGDSFKLARDAAARPEAEYIVFCGVHFMAESADILTSPEQKVVLPDLAAGCSMADMARLAQVEDAWDAMDDAGVAELVDAGDLHELLCRHQGVLRPQRRRRVHLVQRRRGARLGLRAARRRTPRCCSSPTSTSAATPRCSSWASPSTTAWSGTRCSPHGGLTADELRAARVILWKGHCSVHGRFSADVVDELRASRPRHHHPRPPRVQPRRRPQGRPGRLHGVHHQDDRGGPAGRVMGGRHRAQPGQAAGRRPPRQADRLPRPQRLLLLDDEPHRPPPPRLGARVTRRRRRGQPDRGSTPRPSGGPGGPPADARPPRQVPPRLTGAPARVGHGGRRLGDSPVSSGRDTPSSAVRTHRTISPRRTAEEGGGEAGVPVRGRVRPRRRASATGRLHRQLAGELVAHRDLQQVVARSAGRPAGARRRRRCPAGRGRPARNGARTGPRTAPGCTAGHREALRLQRGVDRVEVRAQPGEVAGVARGRPAR